MTVPPTHSGVPVPAAELVERFAVDTLLYCHTFFPTMFRQESAEFHSAMFADLENPRNRQVAFEVFRGGAKTTILQAFTTKRIAYGISHTIMYVSASQAHSIRSLRWIRAQIENNKKWSEFFGLQRGGKWTDEHMEIWHPLLGFNITLIAAGITGQVRGINVDSYRPDLIVVDDADDEETTGTPEQRKKTEERFFGAILKSLTPASENPDSKIVVLATSLHREDLINKCHVDPTWQTQKFPILDGNQESTWPVRHPTAEVLADKAAHISRGQILLWLREMECTVGDEETATFRSSWLRYWDTLPDRMIVVVSCDPAPPPSEAQLRKGLRDKDEEVWSVQALYNGHYYLLEQQAAKDHDPEWSINTFFALCLRWKPIRVRIETTAYQRTLKSLLEREMRARKVYFMIEEYSDRRKKRHRILQAFSGIASQGMFFVHASQQGFISQFAAYPNVDHDDRVDAAAMGMDCLQELSALEDMDMFEEDGLAESSNVINFRRAP